MPCHEFIIYKKKQKHFISFVNIKTKDVIRLDESIINSIAFSNVETYFNYYREKCKKYDLNHLGITIIPPTSLEKLLKVIKSHNKNNEVMKELINLTEEAIKEKNYIIHYGI